jgi:hypothetical protein
MIKRKVTDGAAIEQSEQRTKEEKQGVSFHVFGGCWGILQPVSPHSELARYHFSSRKLKS